MHHHQPHRSRALYLFPLLLGLSGLPSPGANAQQNAAPAQGVRSSSIEEVIVTARRREESMQDTPIAVSALSADSMRDRGIRDMGDLSKSVPSLQIASPQSTQVFIRGVGERTGFARVDPTVGIYLDGLYIPQTDGALLDAFSISSVQVLRGPQGTLFGKNTTGGAIVMSLEKPSQEFGGSLSGGIGNYNRREISGAVNLPITDRFAVKLGLSASKADGYIKDISGYETGNEDNITAIFQSRWDPSDELSMDTLLYLGESDETVLGGNCVLNNSNAMVINGLYLQFPGDTDPTDPSAWEENCKANSREALGDLTTNLGANAAVSLEQRNILFGHTIDWAYAQDHALKFIVGAQSGLEKGPLQTNDSDGGPALLLGSYNIDDSERDTYSLELQFNGSFFNSRLNYSSGLFYMNQQNTEQNAQLFGLAGLDSQTLLQLGAGTLPTQPLLGGVPFVGVFSGPLTVSDFELENDTFAVYSQLTADLTDALQLTVGLRYTREERDSRLELISADADAIANTLTGVHMGDNGPVTFGPPVNGLHPCLCAWAQDPVSVAQSLFPDADGNGIPDYPLDYENTQKERMAGSFSKTTPMASLSYDLGSLSLFSDTLGLDSAMVYATWSQGFKSGFFEPNGTDDLRRVEPETVENRELGLKVDAFDRSLRINAAIYQMDYEDQQLFQVTVDSSGAIGTVFKNVGESVITGGEIEVTWLPTPNLLFNVSASRNDYDLKRFDDLDTLSLVVGSQVTVDRSDEPFPVSPEDTLAIGAQYSLDTDLGVFTVRADYSYKSDIYLGLDPESYDAYQRDKSLSGQEAYSVTDLRLSWTNIPGDTSIALWASNIFDERYTVGPVSTAGTTGTFTTAYGAPRMYGLQVSKMF